MMKIFMSILILVMSRGLFAAANDTVFTVSSPGQDRYADGTVVKDGERYALVWTPAGSAFLGFEANGALLGESRAFAYVSAKNGCCPETAVEISAELMEVLAGGAWQLVLLDTRLADGTLASERSGKPAVVNGFAAIKSMKASASSSSGAFPKLSASSVASVMTPSAVPADAPQPLITSVTVVDGKAFLTVNNTVPYLQYVAEEVALGAGGSAEGQVVAGSVAAQGAASVNAEVVLSAPVTGNSGFYKIIRH